MFKFHPYLFNSFLLCYLFIFFNFSLQTPFSFLLLNISPFSLRHFPFPFYLGSLSFFPFFLHEEIVLPHQVIHWIISHSLINPSIFQSLTVNRCEDSQSKNKCVSEIRQRLHFPRWCSEVVTILFKQTWVHFVRQAVGNV